MATNPTKKELLVTELLHRLEKMYEDENYDGAMIQKVHPAEPFDIGIPTMAKGVYRKPTPMIEARFKYAGTWESAGLGHTWLDVKDMKKEMDSRAVTRQVELRKADWKNSAPAMFPPERLSLFGLEREERQETYLVWGEREGEEPQIWAYGEFDEHKFKNLAVFLKKLLED